MSDADALVGMGGAAELGGGAAVVHCLRLLIIILLLIPVVGSVARVDLKLEG